MSSRTSNLTFNRVDWELRTQLLTLPSGALHARLLSMPLSAPGDGDLRLEEMLRGRLTEHPDPLERLALERYALLSCIRVDRARYSARAIELLEEESEATREILVQLAFPGGGRRMGGELWLTDPLLVLSSVEPTIANDVLSAAVSMCECAESFVPFEGVPSVVEAMGGLDAEREPKDGAFDPPTVSRIAAALETRPPLEPIPGFLKVALEALSMWVPEERELPLDAFVAQELAAIHELFARARTEHLGIDVYWHPNP